MKKTWKAILFDIDGTVFSSEDIIGPTYEAEFKKFREKHGRPARMPDHPLIMDQIGKPIRQIFENLAPDLNMEEREELSEQILHGLVQSIFSGGGFFYDGILEAIQELHRRGYELHAASNGRRPYVESILEKGGVIDLFKTIPVVDNQSIHNKDDLVAHILKENNLKAEEALMIGDRHSDRLAALRNQVDYVACLYGHGAPEEWEGAVIRLTEASQLLDHTPPLQ